MKVLERLKSKLFWRVAIGGFIAIGGAAFGVSEEARGSITELLLSIIG